MGSVIDTSSNLSDLLGREITEMTPQTVQEMLERKGKEGKDLYDIYRLLYNRGIYAKQINSISLENAISELQRGTFRWYGLDHVYTTKDGRNISVPSPTEKIVSGGLRTLLSWYYDGQLSPKNHGFRANKGPASAIRTLARWKGIGWIQHYDIVSCFPSINWDMLKRSDNFNLIQDGRVRSLIKDLTIDGLPVGSPLSPLLCNIYLDVVDSVLIGGVYQFYLRYADNIIVGGLHEQYPTMTDNYVRQEMIQLGLEVKRKDMSFLSVDIGIYGDRVVVARPSVYAVTMIPYYEGMGI